MGQKFINEKRSDVVSSSLLELSVFFFLRMKACMCARVCECVSICDIAVVSLCRVERVQFGIRGTLVR